jgi:hypothetical protein
MLWLFIRSTLVGLAALVIGGFAAIFLFLICTAYFFKNSAESAGSGNLEVGWDLLTIFRNYPSTVLLIPLSAFTVGFVLTFLRFAKSNG